MTIKLKKTLRNHSVTIHLIPFPLNLMSLPSSATSLVRSCWFNSIVEFIPFLGLACHWVSTLLHWALSRGATFELDGFHLQNHVHVFCLHE